MYCAPKTTKSQPSEVARVLLSATVTFPEYAIKFLQVKLSLIVNVFEESKSQKMSVAILITTLPSAGFARDHDEFCEGEGITYFELIFASVPKITLPSRIRA